MIKYCFLKFRVALLTLCSLTLTLWINVQALMLRKRLTHPGKDNLSSLPGPQIPTLCHAPRRVIQTHKVTQGGKKNKKNIFTRFPSDRGERIGADVCCWFDPSEERRLFSSRRPEFNLRLLKLEISKGHRCAFFIFKINI